MQLYADFEFYLNAYHGDMLTGNNADKWLDRASDCIDRMTFRRLEKSFPVAECDVLRVKKAVCAVADALYMIDIQRKAGAAKAESDGHITGAVASVSSGRESVSYATGGTASVYSAAAASTAAADSYIRNAAETYLANVPDKDGVNLLYAGFDF